MRAERLRAAQQALAAAETPDELHDTNDAFLRTLLAMARSPRLGSVMRNMSTVVPGNFFELVPGSGATSSAGARASSMPSTRVTPTAPPTRASRS